MLIDNRQTKLGDELKKEIRSGDALSLITSQFSIYAFEALKKELSKVDSLKLLFSQPFLNSPRVAAIFGDDCEIPLRNKLNQKALVREFTRWIEEKTEIRELAGNAQALTNLVHINKKSGDAVAIQGNSNFTSSGLGYSFSDNIDMNLRLQDPAATQALLRGFIAAWDTISKTRDVKKALIEILHKSCDDIPPAQLYFFTLYHLFKEYVADIATEDSITERSGFKNSLVWNKLYNFQKDGVMGAITKLERYKGCILADSVGLGKTFEALAVIKYYELRNGRVLVLAPKKLRDNWATFTLNDKRNLLLGDRFNYDILNHTDLTRRCGFSGEMNLETINWSNYDLVVIDESHNFRNSSNRSDKLTRYSRLMKDIIQTGVRTKVLMLSATPVNSKLNDLKNQIAFISEGKDNAFDGDGIPSYEATLKHAQKRFNEWMKQDPESRTAKDLTDQLRSDYFKLLDMLTIARSRKHILKYYNTKDIGTFPKRLTPISIRSGADTANEYPTVKELDKIIRKLHLAPYSPLKYVLPTKKDEYDRKYDLSLKGNARFVQRDREDSLVHLMRVNLLKRMESSVQSFRETVSHLLGNVNAFLEKIEQHSTGPVASPGIEEIDIESDEYADMLIGSENVKVLIEDCDRVRWSEELKRDRERLSDLLAKCSIVTEHRDKKLHTLKDIIRKKIEQPINSDNKKVLIFTAFADTAEYLYRNLAPWALQEFGIHSALVTGSQSTNKATLSIKRKDLNSILTGFSPISKERDKVDGDSDGDIDILIATDCISEGQNLQDCDMVVNYDIHWNPVRIIQRFGRIDRLGSKNTQIQLVNFWPDMELDEYINLEARVSGRMVLLDVSATGEENIIDTSQDSDGMNDLKYRRLQLQQLQQHVVDLEDMAGGISITDLTFNEFRMDLNSYLKEHGTDLENGIKGSYAVVDRLTFNSEELPSGVIFCLKQVATEAQNKQALSLAPHYLVYITSGGEIHFSSSQTRKILDCYRSLCKGQTSVVKDALALFNQTTKDGTNMEVYAQLLRTAVQSIIGKEEEFGLEALFDSQSDSLAAGNAQTPDDFECISWLAIV
ncbi:MAG TPA: helicase-related protein [Chitinispirillaceae bacterium]|nr:helicase-related protein [Chitinispirillaceae bacterium]